MAEYYKKNKDKIAKQMAEYYKKNKEKIDEYRRKRKELCEEEKSK
jgi:hypothetical protein